MSEFIAPTSQRAITQAQKEGLRVVFPAANELQLDIDDEAAYQVFEKNIEIIDGQYGPSTHVAKPSRSGKRGKYHITVTLPVPVTSNHERIALQAFLGSDRTREALSWLQAENRDEHPTLFLEYPLPEAVTAAAEIGALDL